GGAGRFFVDNRSLAIPDDLSHPLWQAHGAIMSGRLQVRYGSSGGLAAEAPAGFPVNQLALRATLQSSGTSAVDGNLGGGLKGGDLRDIAVGLYPNLTTVLNGIIPQIDDLPDITSGACGGYFAVPSGGAGLGVRFEMVAANIVGSTATAPVGTCGGN